MSLHEKIMNIECEKEMQPWANTREAYQYGHRDALHAAAELAVQQDAVVKQLAEALKYARRMVKPSECDSAYIDAALAAYQEKT
jgi:hypothetical protein